MTLNELLGAFGVLSDASFKASMTISIISSCIMTVTLANQGYTPYRILQYYYGNDVNIKTAPVKNIRESYPGRALRLGDISEDVRIIQRQLNRIARNYPAIPRIPSPNGIFDTATRGIDQKVPEPIQPHR